MRDKEGRGKMARERAVEKRGRRDEKNIEGEQKVVKREREDER